MTSPFDLDDTAWVWLRHDAGVPARFPATAAPMWEALGWCPCDAPPEVDPTRVEQHTTTAPVAAPAKTKRGA